MTKNRITAVVIFALAAGFTWLTDDDQVALGKTVLLLLTVFPVLFHGLFVFFSRLGFWEVFARDYDGPNHPSPYLIFFWMIYVVAVLFIVIQ